MITSVIEAIARLLFVPMLVVACGLLVKGYVAVGDGFSAGVIAAMGALLHFIVFGHRAGERLFHIRHASRIAVVGLLLSLGIVFWPVLGGRPLLNNEPGPTDPVLSVGTLELHSAVLFDAGVFMLVYGFAVVSMRAIARVMDEEQE